MRKKSIYNKSNLPNHGRFIRKTRKTLLTMKEREAKKHCATCPSAKVQKIVTVTGYMAAQNTIQINVLIRPKRKLDISTRTSEYEPVLGYEIKFKLPISA